MSKLNDERLIKWASHSGRNLFALAIMVSLGTVIFLAVAAFNVSQILPIAPWVIAAVLMSAGYWTFAVGADRGSPMAISLALAVTMIVNVPLCGACGWWTASKGYNFALWVALVPAIIVTVLVMTRKKLLELKKRGLWEEAFGSAKASGHLCIAGSILMAAGFISVVVGAILSLNQLEAQAQRQSFVHLIKIEEQEFMEALGALSATHGATEMGIAQNKLSTLDQKLADLRAIVPDSEPLSAILRTYGDAVLQWRDGLVALDSRENDTEKALKTLQCGDKLRADAIQEYDKRYALPR